MADRPTPERQMPVHVEAAYKDAVDNIIFLKRQQWVATNYALLVYAAIFVISAEYFSRTDFARNSLGIIAIAVFVIHCYVIFVFQRAVDKFRSRLYWIYRAYFNREEQAGLELPPGLSLSHSSDLFWPRFICGRSADRLDAMRTCFPTSAGRSFWGTRQQKPRLGGRGLVKARFLCLSGTLQSFRRLFARREE